MHQRPGDAIFTQREICRVIIDGGGDYFFTVKDNQPTLKSDIALAFGPFSPSAQWSPPADLRRTETIEKGHGRIEARQLEVTASLAEPSGAILGDRAREGGRCGASLSSHARAHCARQNHHRDGLRHHQSGR
jgi:hypothetical protein